MPSRLFFIGMINAYLYAVNVRNIIKNLTGGKSMLERFLITLGIAITAFLFMLLGKQTKEENGEEAVMQGSKAKGGEK